MAVRAKAGSLRAFFVINPDSDIELRVRDFCQEWKGFKVRLHEPRAFEVLRGYREETADRRILEETVDRGISGFLEPDPERARKFSVRALNMLFDYSRTSIDS